MGALRQPRPTESPLKKQPVSETRRDQYGRDPESPAEKLRTQSDLDRDSGYAPLYHAVLADLPRLSSGAVCYAFVLMVNMLSLGRGVDAKSKRRYQSTLPISVADLAELCRANVRDIQRQLADLEERGMIAVKPLGKPNERKYVIRLLYREWQKCEDYAVWKRKQVVSIGDMPDDDEGEGDEDQLPITKYAVKLTAKPQSVRPGRASRAVKVKVGVREVAFQNDSAVDVAFHAVVQSGRLVVAAQSAVSEKGEDKANVARHGCRALPTNEGDKNSGEHLTRTAEKISALFDPLLQKAGSRLLSPDRHALDAAVREVGPMPHEFLIHFVMTQRASRPISAPKVVQSIVKDARAHWERTEAQRPKPQTKQPTLDEVLAEAKARAPK